MIEILGGSLGRRREKREGREQEKNFSGESLMM
jgi:hypothetical protein